MGFFIMIFDVVWILDFFDLSFGYYCSVVSYVMNNVSK